MLRMICAVLQHDDCSCSTDSLQGSPSATCAYDVAIRWEEGAMTWTVEIEEYHAIANWTWDAGDDVCSICRMPFDGCPPDCKVGGSPSATS